jgi:hypothetical protein
MIYYLFGRIIFGKTKRKKCKTMDNRRVRRWSVGFLTMLIFLSVSGKAQANLLPIRADLEAYASDYTIGQVDALFPLQGNVFHRFYLNSIANYGSDRQGYADLGVGYRRFYRQKMIVGGYVFGGYTRAEDNARLWVINPGIEAFGSRWDARINTYFPMGDRHHRVSYFQGHQLGWNTLYPIGHAIYDRLFQFKQSIGPGVDTEVGYQPFRENSCKFFMGGYFFSPGTLANIVGGVTRFEYWLDTKIKLIASYSYDNVRHHTGAVGLGIELGGVHSHRASPDIRERILDPVKRYLAELGHGSGLPNRRMHEAIGEVLQVNIEGSIKPLNNIAYFSQTGGPNNGGIDLTIDNCTFENPCGPSDLSEVGLSTLNILLPETQLYFNGGIYPARDHTGEGPLPLQPGQRVYSYTADYSQLAMGEQRSVFEGGLILNTGNELHGVLVENTLGETAIGILSQSGPILIENSIVGNNHRYNVAVKLINTTDAVLENSFLFGSHSALTVENSSFFAHFSMLHALKTFDLNAESLTIVDSNGMLDQCELFSSTTGFINVLPDYGIRMGDQVSLLIKRSNLALGTRNEEHGEQIALYNGGVESHLSVEGYGIDFYNTNFMKSRVKLGENIALSPDVTCFEDGWQVAC